MMKKKRLLLASPRGFCAGVQHAMDMMDTVLQHDPAPVYCLKELVHNRQVVRDLEQRGVRFVSDVHEIPRGGCVIFSAHGVSPDIRQAARERCLQVFDATCPFVRRLHVAVRRYVREGYHVLLIGNREHDEVSGVRGEAPEHVTVISTMDEATVVPVPDPRRVAAITQTTLNAGETQEVLDRLRRRFPELRTTPRSDICFATHHRQQSARDIAGRTGMVLVLGSQNSSNSNRLVEVCRQEGAEAELIRCEDDLERIESESREIIGLTAGASTPDTLIRKIIARLREKGFSEVVEHVTVTENVHFPLPRALRLLQKTKQESVSRKR